MTSLKYFPLRYIGYILLFIYIIIRASSMSFTTDESVSFSIISEASSRWLNTANHHLLNTWLMSLCSSVFGNSELSLRLPNVLAFLIYAFYFDRILNLLDFPITSLNRLLGFSLLFLNNYVLDFFSLARGYGLSLGFMSASLYYFIRNDGQAGHLLQIKNYILATFFAGLAICSNLSMLNYYIAVMGISVAVRLYTAVKSKVFDIKREGIFFLVFLISTIPLALAIKRLLMLEEKNSFIMAAPLLKKHSYL